MAAALYNCLRMGNFEFNSMEDLVFSRSFRNWVFNRESPEAGFWESWIARNPDKAEMVRHAKAVIYALQLNPSTLSEDDIEAEVQKALQRLKEAPRYFADDSEVMGASRSRSLLRPYRLMTAAALFIVIALAGYLFYRINLHKQRNVFQSFLASHKTSPVREQTGGAFSDQVITLPDSSTVRLAQGSKLYYTPDMGSGTDAAGGDAAGDRGAGADPAAVKGRREVYLDGEAFFDIRKNAARPFYVYTGQVITKVLGTSFLVRSLSSDQTTTVIVKTGKVSVFREDDFYAHSTTSSEPGGIILTPNQEVVYDREQHQLNKTLTDKPEKLAAVPDTALVFNVTPVSRVFKRLQELYGIPIVYDEEVISSCSLTATLGNDSFYDKLNMICKAIGATYEVIDGTIVVTAPGCTLK
jgi:transmembrane sensor